MQRIFGRDPRNKDYEDGELRSGKPILRKPVKEHAERQNEIEEDEFPVISQKDLPPIKPSKLQSSHRSLWLAIAMCLIMLTALLVVGLLILLGKIGHECGCSEENGAQLRESPSHANTFPGGNGTITSELFISDLIDVKAGLDGTKNDLAELNSTVVKVENLKSQLFDVKAALNGTKNDFAKLNSTIVMLNKAFRSNSSESCQNVTGNSAYEECKFKCCCAANSCEETPPAVESCKELYNTNGSDANKAYPLRLGRKILPVYCHMTALKGCGGGGWTLVMKMNGSKDTFHYNKLIWSNPQDYNPSAGATGFDGEETMLPSYWETKFSRICLGMKNGKEINFIAMNVGAVSLYSLIADGRYRPTLLGRGKWKSLLRLNASLQSNCNREGFNVLCGWSDARARIGILSNQEFHCDSCDSRIGFGTGGHPDNSNTCGNVAKFNADNGNKKIKTMGYILVQ